MSGDRRSAGGLGGNRLYIILGAWLVLVVAGGLCTWYGWFAGRGGDTEAPAAAPATLPPSPTPEPVAVQPTATSLSQPEPAQPTQPPAAEAVEEEVFGYGIAINGTGGGPVEFMMGQVESLGLGWVKQQVKWANFEGAPGEMDWSGFDVVVDAANNRGIKVLLSVVDAPTWARTYAGNPEYGAPPDDLAVFADFLGRLVDRYRGRIHAIEVWNEQNLVREWDTAEGVNPEAYVEMLRLAYQTIKSRDPSIIVISGALSPAAGPQADPSNPSRTTVLDDFDYLDRMIASGLLDVCDCVGAHHNGINIPPDVDCDGTYQDPDAVFRGYWDPPQPPHHSWCFKTTLEGYHSRTAAAGRDTPLCVTEFGWATSEGFDGYPPGFGFALDNTLQEQAEWDVRAFQLMREWGFVRLATLWNLNYSQLGWGPEDPNAPYALVDFDGIARPAYGAVGAMPKP
jgi:hypothetical protein